MTLGQIIIAAAALIGVVVGFIVGRPIGKAQGKSQGKQEAQADAVQDTLERTENGRASVSRGRAAGGSPDDRVRANDGAWD